ncbi:hypothetical protein BPAE_0012g00380 [Botrytis paeoniae]|uniref:Uncharacterized protein n=1 Tax=Botrytis paeoniae TaxID=278948 RepID=A0A4Z1G614_9HELO|nr:hypothetical protein BPAE_0012g00380 [Botrytis paeoniae]
MSSIPLSKISYHLEVSARLRLHVLTEANVMSSPSPNLAQYGAELFQAASTEEHRGARASWPPSLVRQSGSPVDSSDATVNASPNSAPSSIPSNPGTPLKDSVTQLLPLINAKSSQQSPLLVLFKKVELLFKCGPDTALFIFLKLQLHIKEKTYKRTGAIIEISIFSQEETDFSHGQDQSLLWRSCKMAATLVLLFATSDDPVSLHNALKSQSHSLGGLPNYDSVRKTPSASLLLAFRRAKLAAQTNNQTTILAVTLVDVHLLS